MSSGASSNKQSCLDQSYKYTVNEDRGVPIPQSLVNESRVLSRFLRIIECDSSRTQDSPNQSSSVRNQIPETNESQRGLYLPNVSSQLSPDAKEFVPRTQEVNSSHRDKYSIKPSNLSATAAEFVPRAAEYNLYSDQYITLTDENLQYSHNPPVLDAMGNITFQDSSVPFSGIEGPLAITGNALLDQFSYVLRELEYHPGNMEEYLRPFCEMVQRSYSTTEMVDATVECLFEESLQKPNFRYTGARACQFLTSNLKDNPYFSRFNTIFIKRCQRECNKREALKHGSLEDQERLRGLAMFMAEIFLNLGFENKDGSLKRYHFLPQILINLVMTLLSTFEEKDVKCSCQLLKLSGAFIEDGVKNSSDQFMQFEEIFVQLQTLQASTNLAENVKLLIGSIIKLKENNWGRSMSSPPKSILSFTAESDNFKVPGPVFYNMNGAPCSRAEAGFPEDTGEDEAYVLSEEEEVAFLEWQVEQDQSGDFEAWCNNDTGYDSYQIDDANDEGGMGDEMEAAYEEFLQKQNATQGYQAQQADQTVQQGFPPTTYQIFDPPLPNIFPHQ